MTARRDSDNYTEVKLSDEIKAWSQGAGYWKIVKDNMVYGEFVFETTRERREDLSGHKKYRMRTSHNVTPTLRAAHRKEATARAMTFSGGEVATVKQLLKMFASGHLFNLARYEVQDRCRNNGATTLQLIEADDVYDWRYDDRSEFDNRRMALRQHIELLEKLEAAT